MSETLSARAQLRLWIRDEIAGRTEVKIPVITERVVERLLSDRELLSEYVRTNLGPIVYEEARRVVASSRELLLLGDHVVTRDNFKERAGELRRSWGGWLEHAGDRNVLLMEMDADDLQAAESERRKRGDAEHELADLWAALRARLKVDQRVKDVFTPEHIEAVRLSLRQVAAPHLVAAT